MLLTQAISDATTSAAGLSPSATLGIFVAVPLVVTGVIAAVVYAVSRPDDHNGFQVLGHPAALSRQERDERAPMSGPGVPLAPPDEADDGRAGKSQDADGQSSGTTGRLG